MSSPRTWYGWTTTQPLIGTVVRLGLAAVWLYAGGSKIGDLAASGRAVNAYQILPYDLAVVIGFALPFVEIALGVLLLVGLATRLAAGISAALLVVFIAGIVSAWARGLAIDCGCFGTGGELPAGQSPSYGPELLRDIGFLALAGFLLRWPRTALSVDGWLTGADLTDGSQPDDEIGADGESHPEEKNRREPTEGRR